MSTGSLHDLLFFLSENRKEKFLFGWFFGGGTVCVHTATISVTRKRNWDCQRCLIGASLLHSLVQVYNQLCPTAPWLITSWQHVILLCPCGAQSLKCRSGASPWIFEYFSFSFTFLTYLDQKMETILKVEICSFLNNKVELFFF